MKTLTDQQAIYKLLDTIEGLINADVEFTTEDLEDYATVAILAHKKYGRKCPMVQTVVSMLEGLGIGTLASAGLDYNDYRAAYQQ